MEQGFIFDYGGTLDTGGCHWGRHIWHAYERAGVPVDEALYREAYVYAERALAREPLIRPDFTFYDTLQTKLAIQFRYLQEHGLQGDVETMSAAVLADLYSITLQHTAHSRDVLSRLAEHFPLVLVSNFYGNIHTVLREFRLDGLFQHVIESAVVGVRKPDPRIFTLGVEALGLRPEEVIVVGDSLDKDILPARQAGCQAVWLRGEQWTDIPAAAIPPVRIITDLKELLSAVSSLQITQIHTDLSL